MAELETFTEQQIAQIEPLMATSVQLAAGVDTVEITDDTTLKEANSLKKDLNNHTRLVKEMRLDLTRPLDEVTKAMIAKEREILAPVEEGKARLSDKILAYTDEVERKRYEEDARIQKIVDEIENLYRPGMTKGQVETARAAAKKIVAEIAESDGKLPRINLALLTLSNKLKERATDIEIEEQRAQHQKLQDDEQRVADERRRLEARKEAQRLEEARIEAEKAVAKAERDRPKSNIVELYEFEIINADMVYRGLCSPDEKKIRAWIKNVDKDVEPIIPGIRIFKTRKAR